MCAHTATCTHHDLALNPVHLCACCADNDGSKLHQQCVQRMGVVTGDGGIKCLEEPRTATAVQSAARQLLTIKSNVCLKPVYAQCAPCAR